MRAIVDTLTRQMLVVNKLQRASMAVESDVILDFLETESRIRNFQYPDSRKSRMRLLQRDIADIAETFHIYIERVGKQSYGIVDADTDHIIDYDSFFTDFDMLTSLDPDTPVSRYVIPERNRFSGSQYLSMMLTAIKRDIIVEFDYVNVRKGGSVRRHKVEPYFLKEDQHRWYLIGINDARKVMIFALDRIADLAFTDENFKRNDELDPAEYFRDSFGIWVDSTIPVEEIELAYSPLDGSFLKTVPLHHSQKILADNDAEFRIKLSLRVTNDFVMALLSRSRSLAVIRPLWLRERIREICASAAERNS